MQCITPEVTKAAAPLRPSVPAEIVLQVNTCDPPHLPRTAWEVQGNNLLTYLQNCLNLSPVLYLTSSAPVKLCRHRGHNRMQQETQKRGKPTASIHSWPQ